MRDHHHHLTKNVNTKYFEQNFLVMEKNRYFCCSIKKK